MRKTNTRTATLLLLQVMAATLLPGLSHASDSGAERITVTLGDYRFTPNQLTVNSGQPLVLELHNTDSITPHNFTLRDRHGGLDVDVDVPAGGQREVELTPQVPGSYTFYCSKKLLFMKSHRERGMEGTLVVTP